MHDTQPLEGFYSQEHGATKKIAPLPDKPCRAVQISVWEEEDDLNGTDVDATAETIYYGFGGATVHPVKPGATTGYIWVTNLNQIYVRSSFKKDGETKVRFSCFK